MAIKTTGRYSYGSVQWYTSNVGGVKKDTKKTTLKERHQHTPKK